VLLASELAFGILHWYPFVCKSYHGLLYGFIWTLVLLGDVVIGVIAAFCWLCVVLLVAKLETVEVSPKNPFRGIIVTGVIAVLWGLWAWSVNWRVGRIIMGEGIEVVVLAAVVHLLICWPITSFLKCAELGPLPIDTWIRTYKWARRTYLGE
jgi:hypothetical protein